jgi:hypothetical protein
MCRGFFLFLLIGSTCGVVDAAEPVDYLKQVKPLLKSRCFACHSSLKQEGSLRLDAGSLMKVGGDSGPAVTPGDVDNSPLYERLIETDESLRMPAEGKPFSKEELAIIRNWIESGARSPAAEQPEEDPRKHWAFRKPLRPAVPQLKDTTWVRNEIDAFLAAQHQSRKLRPAGPADKHILLRRLHLDLIGLPPTRQELQAFLADDSADAYEQVVDRLLERPEHGERWGRHWMDVWRYSDWYGRRNVPDVLNSYAQIWRWRDWIVGSLNRDKGYDRMLMEMLAADEISPGDDENVVATGFIVRNFYRWNYNTWMKDSIEHTGKAFLGLTLNCCHCHSHKYDPIEHEEYFRFRAFFEPIEIRHDRIPGEPDPGIYPKYTLGTPYKPINSGMVRIMDEKLDAKTFVYTGGEARNVVKGKPPVTPGPPRVLGGDQFEITPIDLPPEAWYPGLKPFVQQEEIAIREAELGKVKPVYEKSQQLLAAAEDRLRAAKESGKQQPGQDSNAVTATETAVAAAKLTLRVNRANLVRAQVELAAVKARVHADNVRYKGADGDPVQAAKDASRAERQAGLESARLALIRAERALSQQQANPQSDAKQQAVLKKAEKATATAKAAVEKAEQAIVEPESETYTLFGPQYPKQSSGRRTALAKWLANRNNPLTARVAVNHIWLRHFGRAIVETTANFGRSGDRPTHPQLLDWLAVELMENNWSMKHIHRLIVTSNAYRMRSHTTRDIDPQLTIDRDNVYFWRFNSSRMQAEIVRDSILSVAGSLDQTIGGKEIDQKLGLTTPRRSLYFEHHGEGRMSFLELFDAADPCDCYRRSTSVRPQQALAMSNSELVLREGRLLARRLTEQLGKATSDEDLVVAAFEQVLTRRPNTQEQKAAVGFLAAQRKLFQSAQPAELSAGAKNNKVPASTDPALRSLENLIQALFSHHDFVTIR